MAGKIRKGLAGAAAAGTILVAAKMAKAQNFDARKTAQAIESVYKSAASSIGKAQNHADSGAAVSHADVSPSFTVDNSLSVPHSQNVSAHSAGGHYPVTRERARGHGRTTSKSDIGQRKLRGELKRLMKSGAETMTLEDGREIVYRGEVGSDSLIVDGNYVERVGSKGRARALMRDVVYGANGDDSVRGDKDKPENPWVIPVLPGLEGINPEDMRIPVPADGLVPGPDGGEIDDKDRPAPGGEAEGAPEEKVRTYVIDSRVPETFEIAKRVIANPEHCGKWKVSRKVGDREDLIELSRVRDSIRSIIIHDNDGDGVYGEKGETVQLDIDGIYETRKSEDYTSVNFGNMINMANDEAEKIRAAAAAPAPEGPAAPAPEGPKDNPPAPQPGGPAPGGAAAGGSAPSPEAGAGAGAQGGAPEPAPSAPAPEGPKDNPESKSKNYIFTENESAKIVEKYSLGGKWKGARIAYIDHDGDGVVDVEDSITIVGGTEPDHHMKVTPEMLEFLKKLNPFDEKDTPEAAPEAKPDYVERRITIKREAEDAARALGVEEYEKVVRVEVKNAVRGTNINGKTRIMVDDSTEFRVYVQEGEGLQERRLGVGKDITTANRDFLEELLGYRTRETTDREQVSIIAGWTDARDDEGNLIDSGRIAVGYDEDRDGVIDTVRVFRNMAMYTSFNPLNESDAKRMPGFTLDGGEKSQAIREMLEKEPLAGQYFVLTRKEEVEYVSGMLGIDVDKEKPDRLIFRNLEKGKVTGNTIVEVYSNKHLLRIAEGKVVTSNDEDFGQYLRPRERRLVPESKDVVRVTSLLRMKDGRLASSYDTDGDGIDDVVMVFDDKGAYQSFDAFEYFFKDKALPSGVEEWDLAEMGTERKAHDMVRDVFVSNGAMRPVERHKRRIVSDLRVGPYMSRALDHNYTGGVSARAKFFDDRFWVDGRIGILSGQNFTEGTENGMFNSYRLGTGVDCLVDGLTRSLFSAGVAFEGGSRSFSDSAGDPSTGQVTWGRQKDRMSLATYLESDLKEVLGESWIALRNSRVFWDVLYEELMHDTYNPLGGSDSRSRERYIMRSHVFGAESALQLGANNESADMPFSMPILIDGGYTHIWNNDSFTSLNDSSGGRSSDENERAEGGVGHLGITVPTRIFNLGKYVEVGWPSFTAMAYDIDALKDHSFRDVNPDSHLPSARDLANGANGMMYDGQIALRFGQSPTECGYLILHSNYDFFPQMEGFELGATFLVPNAWGSNRRVIDPVGKARSSRLSRKRQALVDSLTSTEEEGLFGSPVHEDIDLGVYMGYRNNRGLINSGYRQGNDPFPNRRGDMVYLGMSANNLFGSRIHVFAEGSAIKYLDSGSWDWGVNFGLQVDLQNK